MRLETISSIIPITENTINYKILSEVIYYLEDNNNAETGFKEENEYWNLCIQNSNTKLIIFLENEFSIMKSINTKKCDWVLSESNNLYFIESKDVKPRSRAKERKDATKQLIASIEFYNSRLDISEENIYAIICFKSISKIIKPGDQARKLLFREKYNTEYFEANILEF